MPNASGFESSKQNLKLKYVNNYWKNFYYMLTHVKQSISIKSIL
jgi:hypothetical protein